MNRTSWGLTKNDEISWAHVSDSSGCADRSISFLRICDGGSSSEPLDRIIPFSFKIRRET